MATLLRTMTATALLPAAGSAAAFDGQAERGRAVVAANGCAVGHLIPGIRGAQGRSAVDPTAAMPNVGLSEADADSDSAAHLSTRR